MLERWKMFRDRVRTQAAFKNGDWRRVPIQECGDRLVRVPPEMCEPYYFKEMGLGRPEIYLRPRVLQKICYADYLLQRHDMRLKVLDGWRSIDVQASLYWMYMADFTARKFGFEDQLSLVESPEEIRQFFEGFPPQVQSQMHDANRLYISMPSKDPSAPSPHSTGGAIDVWPYRDGKPVDLGVKFDELVPRAATFFDSSLAKRLFPPFTDEVRRNRRILRWAISQAGQTRHAREIWHLDDGDQLYGLVKGCPAIYGYIEP